MSSQATLERVDFAKKIDHRQRKGQEEWDEWEKKCEYVYSR